MLVLSRKEGQKIVISDEITIIVLGVQGNRVRIGIDAPCGVVIRRSELSVCPTSLIPDVLTPTVSAMTIQKAR